MTILFIDIIYTYFGEKGWVKFALTFKCNLFIRTWRSIDLYSLDRDLN